MKKKNNRYCTIYIVRHGETEWNARQIIQGHLDSPLTSVGKKQAKELAGMLKGIEFDAAFSSDLLRAKRTAKIVALEHKLIVKTNKLLRERKYGSWEGKKLKKYLSEMKNMLASYNKLSNEEKFLFKPANDIESAEEVVSRVIIFLREIAIAYLGKTVLVVTHGMAMRSLLIHLGFASFDDLRAESIDHTAYVKILSDGIDFFVKETFGIHKLIT